MLRARREQPSDSCAAEQRVDGPRLARENVACRTEVACSHVSGLCQIAGDRARKKAHRRPDEKVQSSQANSGGMLSGARRVHLVIVGWSTANRPLIAQAHQ